MSEPITYVGIDAHKVEFARGLVGAGCLRYKRVHRGKVRSDERLADAPWNGSTPSAS